MVLKQVDININKNECKSQLYGTHKKIILKWSRDLNENLKLLEEKIGENLYNLGMCQGLLNRIQKTGCKIFFC